MIILVVSLIISSLETYLCLIYKISLPKLFLSLFEI